MLSKQCVASEPPPASRLPPVEQVFVFLGIAAVLLLLFGMQTRTPEKAHLPCTLVWCLEDGAVEGPTLSLRLPLLATQLSGVLAFAMWGEAHL